MRHVDIKKGAPLSPNLVNLKSNTMKKHCKFIAFNANGKTFVTLFL